MEIETNVHESRVAWKRADHTSLEALFLSYLSNQKDVEASFFMHIQTEGGQHKGDVGLKEGFPSLWVMVQVIQG